MRIETIIAFLESLAPPALQESYDNSGLITGQASWECTGVLCCLDATEAMVAEAGKRGCNLVLAHHPIVFSGLKRITGADYVQRTIIAAIKNDIAIYALHTNLDNILDGVNGRMADRLDLVHRQVLQPLKQVLVKLHSFVPAAHTDAVLEALFAAGAGHIGQYSECSFRSSGTGSFRGGEGTQPFVGEPGSRHYEPEDRIEVIFPATRQPAVLAALRQAHPYEEIAYDLVPLANTHPALGAGLIGELRRPMEETEFLALLKSAFRLPMLRHTRLLNRPVKRVAICGGAGKFLINSALNKAADIFVTADIKYHEFFDANDRILLCDIGHYESEQFTIEWFADVLQQKFLNFAVLKSDQSTNPVYYYS